MANKGKKKNTKRAKAKAGRPKPTPSGVGNSVSMPRKPVPGPMRTLHGKTAISEAVCAITDPFCPRAKNAKWPDGMGGNTMTMQIRYHRIVNSFGYGGTLSYCSAQLPYAYLPYGTYASPNFTMNTAYDNVTAGTNFTTYADTYRVVTWGVIIRNLQPALSASGYVTISRITTMPAEGTVIPAGQVNGAQVETHPIFAGQEVHIIGKTQGTSSRVFTPQNTTTTTTTGWEIIKIETSGVPLNSPILDIEFVYNVEFTLPESQTALHQFVQPVVPAAPKAIEAANVVHSRINSVVAGGVDKVGTLVMKSAGNVVEDILAGALGWLGL